MLLRTGGNALSSYITDGFRVLVRAALAGPIRNGDSQGAHDSRPAKSDLTSAVPLTEAAAVAFPTNTVPRSPELSAAGSEGLETGGVAAEGESATYRLGSGS